MNMEDETALSLPPGWKCWSWVDLLPESSPGEFGGVGGWEGICGGAILGLGRGLLYRSPDIHSHRRVSLSTPHRQPVQVVICDVHYESRRTRTHRHIKA